MDDKKNIYNVINEIVKFIDKNNVDKIKVKNSGSEVKEGEE